MTSEERLTKIMTSKPITDISRLIGRKWYLPLEQLAEQSGVRLYSILKAVKGENITPLNEKNLRTFLERL